MPLLSRGAEPREFIPRLRSPSIPFTKANKAGMTVHVLEHPGGTIPVLWKKKKNRDKPTPANAPVLRFKLKTPPMYFMARMNRAGAITDTFLFFTKKKAATLSEPVYMPPLPNIYPSGHICNGTIRVSFTDPVWHKVAEAFRAFWSTPFTEETWPEDDSLIPECWIEPGKYHIEYGYLVYVLEYWQEHDKTHPPDCFPWGHFRPRKPKRGSKPYGTIKTLKQAIDYALAFPNYRFRGSES